MTQAEQQTKQQLQLGARPGEVSLRCDKWMLTQCTMPDKVLIVVTVELEGTLMAAIVIWFAGWHAALIEYACWGLCRETEVRVLRTLDVASLKWAGK